MSIKSKIVTLAVAAALVTGSFAAANAGGPKINPVAAGLFGAAVIGTTIAVASQPQYGYGYPARRCFWKPHYNMFGQFDGNVRICPTYY